jgi:hypothetical protein
MSAASDLVFEQLQAAAVLGPPPEALAREARGEVDRRVQHWAQAERSPGFVESAVHAYLLFYTDDGRDSARRWALGLAVLLVLFGVKRLAGPAAMWWTIAGLVLLGLVLESQRSRRRRRLEEIRTADTCRSCGYDISGCKSAVDAAVCGFDLGPRACPECGLAWPPGTYFGASARAHSCAPITEGTCPIRLSEHAATGSDRPRTASSCLCVP